jgi:putative DNA methylase
MLMNDGPVFIETQFPIARLSAESYKERKANLGQTLTGLGKWWGRKPLVLVRACIFGLLMPASDNPAKDRDVFLKILTMDDAGLWARRQAAFPDRELLNRAAEYKDEWKESDEDRREELREEIWESLNPIAQRELEALRRFPYTREEFDALPYVERIRLCDRPENAEGPSEGSWAAINAHLGTSAGSLQELALELGERRFGHRPRVGDAFCGGGSIPFEAARVGCEAYGSDLNPVAALLTWADLNIIGGGAVVQEEVRSAQEATFKSAEAQVDDWGIERSEEGWRAEAYLYCVEVRPSGCDYAIPLAPSWMIGDRTKVIGKLKKAAGGDRIDIEILTKPSDADWAKAKSGATGTVKDGRVVDPFNPERSWSIESLRGPGGLRLWEKDDLVPRPDDVFQERLYCIRWRKPDGKKVYRAPSEFDLKNEVKVLALLKERIGEWWEKGYVPSKQIESGYNTDQPIRERGWTHWHHLFAPRQLLLNGFFSSVYTEENINELPGLLGVGRMANWNSRLCRWLSDGANEKGADVFSNQALNTMFNYSVRPLAKLGTAWSLFDKVLDIATIPSVAEPRDARTVGFENDLWITDPPYADAVNYHELADFFLAWYEKLLPRAFPDWVPDGRRALAVRGSGEDFKHSMVEIYKNLADHMPGNGQQLVMFTHQDPSVWADLGMILWAAGLRVSAAWTIATETPAGGIKKGNYVQGTVLLVLRKRDGGKAVFMDELYPRVEDEVKRQIDAMRELDDASDPNFGDTDYQLAAYAAALRVLTQYQSIDGQDVGYELFRASPEKAKGRGRAKSFAAPKSRFEQVIDRAIGIACDYLVPRGLEDVWRRLGPDERLYLRALDVESRGEKRQGVYQELARGFGVREVKPILASSTANQTRIKTASEFGSRDLGPLGAEGFGGTMLRQLLFAVHASRQEEKPAAGLRYLKDELPDYWQSRQFLMAVLDWMAPIAKVEGMGAWAEDAEYARLLAGLLRGDNA